jgi:hypothetical protein
MGDYNEMINIIYELIYNKDIKKDIKNKEENVKNVVNVIKYYHLRII